MSSEQQKDNEAPPPSKPYRPHQRAKGNNSKQKNDDKFREKVGKQVLDDYKQKRTQKFTSALTDEDKIKLDLPVSFSHRSPTPIFKRIPFSTFGIGLSVSELFNRYRVQFRNDNCSIYSLYRATLAQLDLQRQSSTHDATPSYHARPPVGFDYPSLYRDPCKANPSNFKVLTFIIESFGRFHLGESNYLTEVPPHEPGVNADGVTFMSLRGVVRALSTNAVPFEMRRDFFQRNPLPGAVVDEVEFRLLNPDDFWPRNYGSADLREDFCCVNELLENMKAKFEQTVGKLTYSGRGRPCALVSVENSLDSVHYVVGPHVPVPDNVTTRAKKRNNRRAQCTETAGPSAIVQYEPRCSQFNEQVWHSSEHLSDLEFSYGILTYCGRTRDSDERNWPIYRMRNSWNSVQKLGEAWSSIFDEATPRTARN